MAEATAQGGGFSLGGRGAEAQGSGDLMDVAEYANIAALERVHWYYAGKREFVRAWIERVRPPAATETLLDCGAGTGQFAEEMAARCRVLVLDDHEEALRMLRTRFRAEQILSLAGDQVPLPAASLEYVTALDVLEHVPDDAAVVRGFARLLKPGGLAVVTVPASMALWSDWDTALHHFRRYERAQLKALFAGDEWELVHANYTNTLVFPAVWLVRKWRAWTGAAKARGAGKAEGAGATARRAEEQGAGAAEVKCAIGVASGTGATGGAGAAVGTEGRETAEEKDAGATRSEDKVPPRWLNAVLRTIFVRMALWCVPMPFGVSLVLVARRRG